MTKEEKQRKLEYNRIVKIVKEAKKEAERFIRKNTQITSSLRMKLSS
jgi:hypothetical protein